MAARFLNLAAIAILALGLLTVACGGDDDDDDGTNGNETPATATNTTEADGEATEQPTPESTATEEPDEELPTEISITAEGFAFSTGRIRMQAGVETTITMNNNDDVGHNFHVIAGSVNEATEIFAADESPMTLTLTIETPGTYQFQCDVHPTTMLGTVEVVE